MLNTIQTKNHFIFLLAFFLGLAGKLFTSTLSAQSIRSSAQKEIKLFDPTGAGNGNIAFSATGGTQSYTLRFPVTPPAANQLLGVSSFSAGIASLSWSTPLAGIGSGASGQVAYWSGPNSQTGSNDLFWNASNKRFGIGTSSPSEKLTINEPSSANVAVSIIARGGDRLRSQLTFGVKDNNSSLVGGSLGSDGNIGGGLILNGNTNDISTGTSHMVIKSDGRIFINGGTDKGNYRLQINGDMVSESARFTQINSSGYSMSLGITSDGTLAKSSSDIRLKKNIETIQQPLEKVLALRGVTYNWRDSSMPKRMMGMIAQEVLPIAPELVFQNQPDGYYGINYGETAGLLIEAIKAQQVTIQELKKTLSVQQQEINYLKKQLISLQPKP